MKKYLLIFAVIAVFVSIGCEEEKNEDIVRQPDKTGSIETSISISHGKGFDLLLTSHRIWNKGRLDTIYAKVDTLKALGDTCQPVTKEDESDEATITTTRTVCFPKEYEIYITVK